ncbi:MAG: prenyltransferase/squalene oxidase repeat-containing protein [Candidatus Hermodarchaeota archaeon]
MSASISSRCTSMSSENPLVDEPPNNSATNYDLIEQVMEDKLSQYVTQGYFSQEYIPSIQAIYYALASLHKLGKLTEVSFSEIAAFLLSYYNQSTKFFMDEYTKRYLDTNYSIYEFPLNSLLLTNCYAILSLNLIGYLNEVDIDAVTEFIWSCYNPETSGFIGVPYNIALHSEWRISTMDNTYYAVLALNVLMSGDWSAKLEQQSAIIDYIESLQDIIRGGGFHNDLDLGWTSLKLAEPNIYASYFCIKTLQIFNWIPAINLPAFHEYLESLYQPTKFYFESMKYPNIRNLTNVVTSALGLALCHLTANESFISKSNVINFILTHRNPEGGFYRSSNTYSSFIYYELLDTYQILCGLEDAGEFSQLSISDKQELASFIMLYKQKGAGYAPISKNYVSLSLLQSIIGSFYLFDRETELPIQSLYNLITSYYDDFLDQSGFTMCKAATTFRVYPIDYLCIGTRQLFPEITLPETHHSTYLALASLKNLRKLDDFATSHNLQLILDSTLQSQFLDVAYTQNFGAFNFYYNPIPSAIKNELITLKYSYYAIKVMELIVDELDLGAITTLAFDVDALDTYILRHIITTSSTQYITDGTIVSPESLIEQTYFGAYILKALNRNSLNASKIYHFIETAINYSNIKNVYYCFKLSELLNLDYEFDILQVHNLIQTLYSADHQEFYLSVDQARICQDALFYIAEMAKTDHIRILASYPSEVALGNTISFEVNLANLVLKDFGPYTTVKLESNQLGTFIMDQQADLSFEKEILIPAIADNFPSISGNIIVYEGSLEQTFIPFKVYTIYDTLTFLDTSETATKISFTINASVTFFTGTQAILNGRAYINVYKNHLFIDRQYFSEHINLRHTLFHLEYYPSVEGTYRMEIFLLDGINPSPQKIAELNYTCKNPDFTGGYRGEAYEFYALIIPLGIIPGVAIIYSRKERFNFSPKVSNTQVKAINKKPKFSILLGIKKLSITLRNVLKGKKDTS